LTPSIVATLVFISDLFLPSELWNFHGIFLTCTDSS
jgi:hypothetical protein